MGSTFVGGFAEAVLAPAAKVVRIPGGVPLDLAAAFSVAHGTAYHSLVTTAAVAAGEWVAVLGAAGGVGSATVELGTLLGAHVVAVASTPEKRDQALDLGAEAAIGYDDLKAELRRVSGGGVDVVVDPVGGDASEPALRALRHGGRFVCVGFASGVIPRIPLNLLLLKGVWATGLEKRTLPERQPEAEARSRAALLGWLAEGRLRPRIGARFPLGRADEALAMVAGRQALGKVLVDIHPRERTP
jgi:NADPH2:quinone reductase